MLLSTVRLLSLALTAAAIAAAAPASAARVIAQITISGDGVVTAAEPGAPPVGTPNHITISAIFYRPLWPGPFIDEDATGLFFLESHGGVYPVDVTLTDVGGVALCEYCYATFTLSHGHLVGDFGFFSGVEGSQNLAAGGGGFFGGRGSPSVDYTGSWKADTFIITTVAIPEPAAWAMMIAGFAAVGQALRRRPRLAA
jgi:hypothetical protein